MNTKLLFSFLSLVLQALAAGLFFKPDIKNALAAAAENCPAASAMPDCAIQCIQSVAPENGCPGSNDIVCNCQNAPAIQSAARSCVLEACGLTTAMSVQSIATAICNQCGGGMPSAVVVNRDRPRSSTLKPMRGFDVGFKQPEATGPGNRPVLLAGPRPTNHAGVLGSLQVVVGRQQHQEEQPEGNESGEHNGEVKKVDGLGNGLKGVEGQKGEREDCLMPNCLSFQLDKVDPEAQKGTGPDAHEVEREDCIPPVCLAYQHEKVVGGVSNGLALGPGGQGGEREDCIAPNCLT